MLRTLFRGRTTYVAAATLVTAVIAAVPAQGSQRPATADRVDVYTGTVSVDRLGALQGAGLDQEGVVVTRGAKAGQANLELTITGTQARQLAREGIKLHLKKVDGQTAALRSALAQETVFRPYSGAGNIREELLQVAAEHPRIAQAVTIGTSVQGKPITAVRVTKDVAKLTDRKRPAVLYRPPSTPGSGSRRRWSAGCCTTTSTATASDPEITKLVDTTELWFVPVANPDGYDYTFTPGNRLWRKNLRDNNGDGQITASDGVDLNRNFAYKWGYDNEGSSPDPPSETYRGPAPGSEPETAGAGRAVQAGRLQVLRSTTTRPPSCCSTASAGRSHTRSPDDLIYEAMAGDDAPPGRARLRPGHLAPSSTPPTARPTRTPQKYGTLGLHAGDVDLRDRRRLRPERRSGARGLRAAASTSRTTRS